MTTAEAVIGIVVVLLLLGYLVLALVMPEPF